MQKICIRFCEILAFYILGRCDIICARQKSDFSEFTYRSFSIHKFRSLEIEQCIKGLLL